MTSKRGGRPTKDSKISDNFNQQRKGMGRDEARAAKIQAQIEADAQAASVKELKELSDKISALKKRAKTVSRGGEPEDQEEDQERGSSRMLKDLRYGYKNSVGPDGKKGKERLVELMENDAEFKFAVKELMRIESALLTTRIRTKTGGVEGGGRQSFFVVLKGLEQERPLVNALGAGKDAAIDVKQILNAISPETTTKYEPETEKGSRDRPDEVLKVARKEEGL